MRAQNGSKTGSASERPPNGLSRPPCAWPDLIWTIGAPCSITDLELGDREVDVGERDVGRQEHAALVRVADLLVDPAVERADVGVERLDVVGELELDVVRARGEHQRLVDALLVHERQAQVAVAVRLALFAELAR